MLFKIRKSEKINISLKNNNNNNNNNNNEASQNSFLPVNLNFSKLLMLSGAQLIIWNTGLKAIILSFGMGSIIILQL
ncbi:MAG: hypothetical protein ACPK85_05185 [Methanosarcina sp.]